MTAQKHGEDIVPWQTSEQRERKTENGPDDGAEHAVARRGDGGAEIRLQNDDGADRSPVAVVQSKSQRDPPAKRGGERRSCG